MALILTAKAPTAVFRYTWDVPLADCDSVSSASVAVAVGDATVDGYDYDDATVTIQVSGGTETTGITVTAETNDGETIVETLYLPIIASTSSAETVQDVVSFALRKVFGIGQTPPADASDHAIECLTDMLEEWRVTGADVGAPGSLESATVLYCPNAYLKAIKNNLILQVADVFGLEVGPVTIDNARRGLQLIKSANLSPDREAADYF